MARKPKVQKNKRSTRQGRFIVLDGPDGAGKTTQAQRLKAELERRKVRVMLLREPGGTAAGEAIRKLLLEQKEIGLQPLTEAFLFQAARAELIESVVGPALKRGTWVICDRFTLSTLVYQALAGGVDAQAVELLSTIATSGLEPDRYLVLWVPPKTGVDRRKHRSNDRMESKGARFINDVSRAFKSQATKQPSKYRLLDGTQTPEEVQASIWNEVEPLLR